MRIPAAIALSSLAIVLLPSLVAVAELAPFDHYRVILDRKPFGDLTPPKQETPAAPVVDQTAIEEKKKEDELAKQIDMVAVNRTPRGKIAVGFIDKNAKPPRNYYLNVGDTSGGFTVLEADFNEETAMIEKDGVSIALKLGKGVIPKPDKNENDSEDSANDGGNGAAPVPSPVAQPIRPFVVPTRTFGRSGMTGLRNTSATGAPNARPGLSYAERVRERRAQENREAAARDREAKRQMEAEVEKRLEASKADAAKREREINIELIRRGEAPVSDIELTEEEDAALVEAGALPQQ